MVSQKWARGTIRISSEVLTPQEITGVLGLQPSKALEKGARAIVDNPRSAILTHAVWLLESGLPSASSLEAHIEALLDMVEGRADALEQLAKTCDIEFFLGFSSDNGQGGFTIEHDVLARIAELPIDLSLDLYPPEG
jgi:hypothetical protein